MRVPRPCGSVFMALLCLGLAACASPVPSTGPSSSSTTSPATPSPIPVSTADLARYATPGGFTFNFPSDWHAVDVSDTVLLGGSSVMVMLANFPLPDCGAPPDLNCLFRSTVPPGGVLLNIGSAAGSYPIFDPSHQWTETIDGLPARTSSQAGHRGVDEIRSWVVAMPHDIWQDATLEAAIRGPGRQALDAQVDALARSIRFETHPRPLDPTRAGETLRAAVEYIDQDARQSYQTTFYGCFPRTIGERQATLEQWWGNVLPRPVPVTCASAIEATVVELWRISLSVRWDAVPDVAAGEWREDFYFDADATWVGQVSLTPDSAPLGEAQPSSSLQPR